MLIEYLRNTWEISASLAPWLLLGLVAAGLLHVFLPEGFIRRHLGTRGWGSTLKAVFLGVPVPLCSCGVIPTAIGLRKDGASNGAAVGFLISTPQTGVDSIAVAAAFLGWPFALFKVLAAFVTGILGGWLTDLSVPEKEPEPEPVPGLASATEGQSKHWLRDTFAFAFDDLLYMIWKWILVGVLVSAAITTWIPADAFADQAWATGLIGMVGILLISTPLYVCATSSVPIAAALVHAGLPSGAALVFLMAGPASNVATIGAVYRAFGKKVLGIYLAVITLGSLAFGYLFTFVLSVDTVMDHHEHGIGWFTAACIVVLYLLILRYAIRDLRGWWQQRRATQTDADEHLTMTVAGMTCQGCVAKVRDGLTSQPGVQAVEVDLDSGKTTVHGQNLDQHDFPALIRQLGFSTQ